MNACFVDWFKFSMTYQSDNWRREKTMKRESKLSFFFVGSPKLLFQQKGLKYKSGNNNLNRYRG